MLRALIDSRSLAVILLLSACGEVTAQVRSPLPLKVAQTQSEEVVRASLKPWIGSLELLLKNTNDAEVRSDLQVLRNAALLVPSSEGGPMALAERVVVPPPDPTRPWIGVIVINSGLNLPSGRWQELASTTDFAAEYFGDTNTICLRSDISQIPVIRGLLVVHEMRHWFQVKHFGTENDRNIRIRRELDAYAAEFRILDALDLPKYRQLIMSERLRMRKILANHQLDQIQPDVNNPLLEQTFGRFPSAIAKQMAAAEIALHAAFSELDALPAGVAEHRKERLLQSLGYQ